MAVLSDFTRLSESPYDRVSPYVRWTSIANLSIKGLRVWMYILEKCAESESNLVGRGESSNPDSVKIELEIQGFRKAYGVELQEVSYSLWRDNLARGIVELLEANYIARTYEKGKFWVNIDLLP